MSDVAILGCGPAGLLAAHAASLCGHSVNIFSKKQKSPMEGAQYMHTEIPDVHQPPPSMIKYTLIGDVDVYRQKVYGSGDPDITVSPEQYLGSHKCWDLRATYSYLWDQWESRIRNLPITQQALEHITNMNDFVISTIPAPVICAHSEDGHEFQYVPVWIDNQWSGPLPAEAPDLWDGHQNLVICNGLEGDMDNPVHTGWYRTSHIYGHTNTEWARAQYVPDSRTREDMAGIWRVRKPIMTNCDCWQNIIRCGRYGLWQKGVLTHHAFERVINLLS